MKRLTKLDRYNHFYTNEKIYSRTDEFDCFDGSCIDKLGLYEVLEEKYAEQGIEDLYKFLEETLEKIKIEKIEKTKQIVVPEINEEEFRKIIEKTKFDEVEICGIEDIKNER